MALLDRKTLLKPVLKIEKVVLGTDAEGNEEIVYVREMSGYEREFFEKSIVNEIKDDEGNVTKREMDLRFFRAKLAVVTICDENGKIILRPEDYEELNKSLGFAKLNKIADAAQKLNTVGQVAVNEQVKNSGADLNGNSNSGSVVS